MTKLWNLTDEFLNSEYDVSRCSYKLFSSSLFAEHTDYIRRQIIYSLLQVRSWLKAKDANLDRVELSFG
jgi:hypothetical protein